MPTEERAEPGIVRSHRHAGASMSPHSTGAVIDISGALGLLGRHSINGLQRTVGNTATTAAIEHSHNDVSRRSASHDVSLQRLGTPLDQKAPSTEPKPAFGETKGEQRRFTPEQYMEMWEAEQGRKLLSHEKVTLARGCIGITAANLNGGGDPPLDNVFGTFAQAHDEMKQKNAVLDWLASRPVIGSTVGPDRYVMFGKLFWSNQNPDATKRKKADKKAYLPDKKTGRVDMTGYDYQRQPGFTNFDYGFWDEASQSFWHANHMDYGDPADPMIVMQSTRDKFAHVVMVAGQKRYGYPDFDRVVYGVALAKNYNPGLAAISKSKP